MVKLLLDTDIGSDIDDAVCLAYLLAQPECELLGITTVSGEATKRAALADALCRVAGRDVPIFAGVEQPLLVDQHQPQAPQASALAQWPHREDFASGRYLEFMSSTIRQHPGQIVLLSIGPLTNVALLCAADPEAVGLLKGVVSMCGVFTRWQREWNALCDPHAAAMVYRAPLAMHRSIGLDVTERVQMAEPEVRQRFGQHELLRPVLDFAAPWFQHRPVITFHDPLAAATIFDDSLCQFQRGAIDVELISPKSAGMTYWDPTALAARHEVATAVDAARFFEHYFAVFK